MDMAKSGEDENSATQHHNDTPNTADLRNTA
jgi:hypothetical protein